MTSEPHPISTHIWIFPARFPPQMPFFQRSLKPFTSLLPGSKKAPKHNASEQLWCRWRGSNPHELLAQRILSPPRLPIPTHRQAPLQYSTDSGKMQEKVFPPPGKTHERVFPGKVSCGCFIRRRVPRSDICRSQNLPGCAVRGRSRCHGTAEKAQCRLPAPRRRLSAFPDFPEG